MHEAGEEFNGLHLGLVHESSHALLHSQGSLDLELISFVVQLHRHCVALHVTLGQGWG